MQNILIPSSACSVLLTAALLSFSLFVPPAVPAASFDVVEGNKAEVSGGTFAGDGTYSLQISAKDATPGAGADGYGSVVGTPLNAGAEQWGSFTANVVCVYAVGGSARVVAEQTSPIPPDFAAGIYLWVIDVEDLGQSSPRADRARIGQFFGGDPEVDIPNICTDSPLPLFEANGDIAVKDGACARFRTGIADFDLQTGNA